jgi:SAM-dependent methyltransferase
MSATVESLPPVAIEGHRPSGYGDESHPMRVMTRRIAGLAPGGWDRDARRDVADLFDSLAPEWHTRSSPERTAVVADALDRGWLGEGPNRLAVELGSGIGVYSGMVAERFATAVAVELAMEMAERAPSAPARRVVADGARLPVGDGSVDAVVLVNAFLFPQEVGRVVRPGGAVVWVNSSGEQTPIHLTTWCVLRRSG